MAANSALSTAQDSITTFMFTALATMCTVAAAAYCSCDAPSTFHSVVANVAFICVRWLCFVAPVCSLFQVEYAIEAIKLGTTAIGIQTSEGVVLAVEKRITSKLLVPSSIQKLVKLDVHIGCAMSGLIADARTLVDHARVETQNHWFSYDEKIGVEACVQSICDLALGFGEGEMVRRCASVHDSHQSLRCHCL